MNTENVVMLGNTRYRLPTAERFAEARKWLDERGPLAHPSDFFAKFPEAEPVTGFPGSSAFRP